MSGYISEIRWRAILAGIVVSLILSFVLAVIYGQIMSYVGAGWLESNELVKNGSPDEIQSAYKHFLLSPVWLPGWMAIAAITHVASGYVTAFYAKRLELVHGALLGVLVGIGIFNVAASPVAFVACILGAHIRRRHAGVARNTI